VDAGRDETRSLGVQGQVFVRAANYQPVLFTLDATQTLGENGIRQLAEIRYQMSPYGAVLPSQVYHADMRGTTVVAENTFRYSNFRRFGASSAIVFEADPSKASSKAPSKASSKE